MKHGKVSCITPEQEKAPIYEYKKKDQPKLAIRINERNGTAGFVNHQDFVFAFQAKQD